MAKAIITGSNGFIGRHLQERLQQHYVKPIPLPRDLLYNPEPLKAFLEETKPDYIFHLASYGNHYFQTEADKVFNANVQGLWNLLEASQSVLYKGLINFSTTYHNQASGSFYGATKASGEYLTRAFVRNYGKPIVNIRPYSVFGEREWDFRFIPTISRQIRANQPITVWDVTHDWVYVEDFLTTLISVTDDMKKYTGKTIGIGTGTRRSNIDIAKQLMELTKNVVPMNQGQKREYEIAAYNKELTDKTEAEKQEIFIPSHQTPFETALMNVYNHPEMALKRTE
jgi:nucleoside-diphosphate-sugar epimerase